MSDDRQYQVEGPYGSIEFDGAHISEFGGEITATLTAEEPYRESSGHSVRVTPEIARDLARALILFAYTADQQAAEGKNR